MTAAKKPLIERLREAASGVEAGDFSYSQIAALLEEAAQALEEKPPAIVILKNGNPGG